MAKKDIFINAVGMIRQGGRESIPTVVNYGENGSPLIGCDAIDGKDRVDLVNDDFKIDLGKIRPGQAPSTRELFPCADGKSRSAFTITSDFLSGLLALTEDNLLKEKMEVAKRVLVSEPLSFLASDDTDWLERYRGNIRRMLEGKFTTVEFFPEPFAVYQYYRYGCRHSLVTQDKKHCALVVDFGGGTFDVSIVETSQGGNISRSGKHARPLGASSVSCGGFEINRVLARKLVMDAYASTLDKDKLRKGIENYFRWRNKTLDFDTLNPQNRRFLVWFSKFLRRIEDVKIDLVRKISNWKLDANLSASEKIDIPVDPFSDNEDKIILQVSASTLRDVFRDEIWKRQLKNCVKHAIEHSRKELSGRPIDIVLLSGGSANFRWLEALLKHEFEAELYDSEMVSLRESYQEIVAKGLAIECTRRGYEPNSEFKDVTYNPLYLALNPDDSQFEVKSFKLLKGPEGMREPTMEGELISSAETLDSEDDLTLVWKVRLDRPPKQRLQYHFLRGTPDSNEFENIYNVIQRMVPTPAGTRFDAFIKVELTFRNDGTCFPRFIYRTNPDGSPAVIVNGSPFYIDLIKASSNKSRDAYIGIDFGTATSAISFVDWKQVDEFSSRGKEDAWLKLNELIDLPNPIAAPLRAYLGSTRHENQARLAMDTLEGMLGFMAFVSWAEASSAGLPDMPKSFRNNWKRSAGPLKRLLTDMLDSKIPGYFMDIFRKKISREIRNDLDVLIQSLDDEKHHKKPPGSSDPKPLLEKLGNICKDSLNGWVFGYFDDMKKIPFQSRYSGTFFVAIGTPPYHRSIQCKGSVTFAEEEAVLANLSSGEVLKLLPLYIWHRPSGLLPCPDCMVLDGIGRDNVVDYKKSGVADSLSLREGEWAELDNIVRNLYKGEFAASMESGFEFASDSEWDA